MNYKEFRYELLIRESHLDTFGHVNNAMYLTLLEEARWDFITKGGYGLGEIQSTQKGPVILEASIKYKRELKNREIITITSQASGKPFEKIMSIQQNMLRADGKVAAEAHFTVGLMDLKERKLIVPDNKWMRAIGFEGEL